MYTGKRREHSEQLPGVFLQGQVKSKCIKNPAGSVINDEPGGNAVYIEIIYYNLFYARRTSEWSHRRYLYS